jgi:hypothetical protein
MLASLVWWQQGVIDYSLWNGLQALDSARVWRDAMDKIKVEYSLPIT